MHVLLYNVLGNMCMHMYMYMYMDMVMDMDMVYSTPESVCYVVVVTCSHLSTAHTAKLAVGLLASCVTV